MRHKRGLLPTTKKSQTKGRIVLSFRKEILGWIESKMHWEGKILSLMEGKVLRRRKNLLVVGGKSTPRCCLIIKV